MAWVKLDDQWMDHPKIIRAGRDARDMWLASITWCAKHLTDGYFPNNLLPQLAVMAGIDVANCQTFATTLLDLCLWDATENGYMVHDYLDYNPTKEQVLSTREARKEAGRAGGVAKASKIASKLPSKIVAKVCPVPIPIPINGNGNGSGNKQVKESAKRTPRQSAEPSHLFEIASALAMVTGIDFEKNRGRLFKEAKAYKPEEVEQIKRDYGEAGAWFIEDWRGKKGQTPTLGNIRDTWNKFESSKEKAPEPEYEDYFENGELKFRVKQ